MTKYQVACVFLLSSLVVLSTSWLSFSAGYLHGHMDGRFAGQYDANEAHEKIELELKAVGICTWARTTCGIDK